MEKKKKIRNRLRRDLTIAAAVIVLVLVYFIPSLMAGAQDLSFAGKQSAYEAETVRFSSESVLLAERLSNIQRASFGEDNSLILLDTGNLYNRDSALEAVGNEWIRFLDSVPEDGSLEKAKERIKSITTDPDVQKEAAAVMAIGSTSGEPFILWVYTFIQEERIQSPSEKEYPFQETKDAEEYAGEAFEVGSSRQLSVFMDESSGKILGAEYEEWQPAEYYPEIMLQYSGLLGDAAEEYYGMQRIGTQLLTEDPYAAVISLSAGEDAYVSLPVVFHAGGFSFNTPETTDFIQNYGIPSENIMDEEKENAGF